MDTADKKNAINTSTMALGGLCVYRSLLADPVITAFRTLVELALLRPHAAAVQFIEQYSEFFNILSSNNENADFSRYVFEKVILDENVFTNSSAVAAERVNQVIYSAACSDIRSLRNAVSLAPAMIKGCYMEDNASVSDCRAIIDGLPDWTANQPPLEESARPESDSIREGDLWRLWTSGSAAESIVKGLSEYHAANGSGLFSRIYAFTWKRFPSGNGTGCIAGSGDSGRLVPVHNPDPVRLSDLIAYESEREEVIKNTEQFLDGFSANNVLLYGDRGTGKSSTVKALINEYHPRGLRMVEVSRSCLVDFPEIVGILARRPYKFILFVDDLSFEDSEDAYTALKAAIEGSLEMKPQNILIYATSNRKHLVRESFRDRQGLQYGSQDDEIRAIDTIQEKLSLSDRFGITVVFASPDKKRFLEIVDKLAQKNGIDIEPEILHKEALKWELWYNGRSPRTAQQFISYMAASRHSSV